MKLNTDKSRKNAKITDETSYRDKMKMLTIVFATENFYFRFTYSTTRCPVGQGRLGHPEQTVI
jgi:hypothetical protein